MKARLTVGPQRHTRAHIEVGSDLRRQSAANVNATII